METHACMGVTSPDGGIMLQIGIALTGGCAVWLSQDSRPERRRWACVLGLAGQPLWALSAWQAEQWGILALTCWYALAWARGIREHWL